MAGKRRAVSESDDGDSPSATPASKRARTEDTDEEQTYEEASSSAERNHKTKNARFKADDELVEDEQELQENDLEVIYSNRIRAQLAARQGQQGGVAEHGIIESIEMHNFMCHTHLNFTFGPQINFVIGHNGSGKSAVLSAITVALGGKATSTGRGNGLKSFIREGQTVAEVSISLKNQGEEAYKPKEYGKTIRITRRFDVKGSSTWRIKSEDDTTISTKKDELAAICDHMNIQVDNPMNVLTQDAARQFLSASQPSNKYKFFLRGTQLSQLSEEYQACLENITQTQKVLEQKKEVLPELREKFKEISERFAEAQKAREQKQKADDLKQELAWAHVAAKEEEMAEKILDCEKQKGKVPMFEGHVAQSLAAFETATTDVTTLQAEIEALGNMEELERKKGELSDKMRQNRDKIRGFAHDTRKMNESINECKAQIEKFSAQIEEEERRMQASTQTKRDETARQLDQARAASNAVHERLKSLGMQKAEKDAEADSHQKAGRRVEQDMQDLQRKIGECNDLIERLKRSEQDKLSAYGQRMTEVMQRVNHQRWNGDVPLGPLGSFVQVKDDSWADVLRRTLGPSLTAWAVTDSRDVQILKKIFSDTGNRGISIIVYEKDMFDYSGGEPPEGYNTVLRTLEISDPYVTRILINNARIESTVLAPTRKQAEGTLASMNRGGVAWSKDLFTVRVFPEGGKSSTPLGPVHAAFKMLLAKQNAASQIQTHQNELTDLNLQYKTLVERLNQFKAQHNGARHALIQLDAQEKKMNMEFREAKGKVDALQQAANDDMPVEIAGIQGAKAEAEAEKDHIIAQFAEAVRQKEVFDHANNLLVAESEEIKKKLDDFEAERNAVVEKINKAAERRMQAQSDKQHWDRKLKEEQKKVDDAEAVAKVLQEEFEKWTQKALEYCPRYDNPRKVNVVQRNLDAVQRALQESQRTHGASVEDMAVEVNKAKHALETADRDHKQMTMLNKSLSSSLKVRLHRWHEFRRHIALRCKYVFQYHLSHRGYYGKVLFDHDKETLDLKVKTDDQMSTRGRDKDPQSLSGGEKSFSTICLLLSLWESIGCPLRCLDEFDVFMDAVNRRISMRMMIDTANQSDKKQYILITPQDMGNIRIEDTVRVHRMTDPERGQGVPAFGA